MGSRRRGLLGLAEAHSRRPFGCIEMICSQVGREPGVSPGGGSHTLRLVA